MRWKPALNAFSITWGRLPYVVQNAAAATVWGHAYLLGGERDGVVLDDVVSIDYMST